MDCFALRARNDVVGPHFVLAMTEFFASLRGAQRRGNTNGQGALSLKALTHSFCGLMIYYQAAIFLLKIQLESQNQSCNN